MCRGIVGPRHKRCEDRPGCRQRVRGRAPRCAKAARHRTGTVPRSFGVCAKIGFMDLGLRERAFVVTAASAGLGRATASELVAEGAKVVLVARRSEVLAEVVAELGRDNAVSLAADLADVGTADAACQLALDRFGRLDGALISVGGPAAGRVADTTEEQWAEAFQSVFLAGLRVTHAVVAHSQASDLVIGWVLSTSVKSPVPGLAASNGLRPGLGMLVKQLADELGPEGTRVVGLMPGRIETERVRHLDSLADDPAASRAAGEAAIPLRRSGQPAEFGRVAAFLLSPAASYLTGCVIPVEGGALRAL
jgi:3-oxoacyl-[acyl-carrier protein] reductase